MRRWAIVTGIAASAVVLCMESPALAQSDPLPSWNGGPVKQAIRDFIARTTTAGGGDFVPVPERIATFDNDGRLWTEQPIDFQAALAAMGEKGLLEIVAATHAGLTTAEFSNAVDDWLATAPASR